MAYYWITEAQKYIHSLGFGVTRRPIDNRAAGRAHQPVGHGQLVRDRPPQERAALRQGRRRRRRGRRGDPARVRPRHPLRAELQLRLGAGRRDQRGLRRLLGRHGLGRRREVASAYPSSEPLPCVAGLGRDLLHEHRPALPATASTRTCTTRPTSNGEVHHDGQIWSRALWDIRQALGNVKADTIILQGSFDFPGRRCRDLANWTPSRPPSSSDGNSAANAVQEASPTAGSSRDQSIVK